MPASAAGGVRQQTSVLGQTGVTPLTAAPHGTPVGMIMPLSVSVPLLLPPPLLPLLVPPPLLPELEPPPSPPLLLLELEPPHAAATATPTATTKRMRAPFMKATSRERNPTAG
jgi:hypothetical protein